MYRADQTVGIAHVHEDTGNAVIRIPCKFKFPFSHAIEGFLLVYSRTQFSFSLVK